MVPVLFQLEMGQRALLEKRAAHYITFLSTLVMELDLWGACGEPLSHHLQAAGNPGWGAAENKGR